MVRDKFAGAQMAQVMSIALTVFILVPTFAPAIGQLILLIAPWQMLFVALLAMALIGGTWLTFRQPETHTELAPFEASRLLGAFKTVVTTPISMLYAMAAAVRVRHAAWLHRILATNLAGPLWDRRAVCLLLRCNGSLYRPVEHRQCLAAEPLHDGMITAWAIGLQVIWSLAFLAWISITDSPSLMVWMVFISVTLFFVGITFGNYNAIALRPLGKIAGIASSITASIQTLISVLVAPASARPST
jgi:DHA1 family bicyclomycin/chloramphenicol resistance-like MFS transporter